MPDRNYTTQAEPATWNLKYRGDYIGMRFGSLTVFGYPVNSKGVRESGAYCKCDCGEEVLVRNMGLLFGGVTTHCKTCGRKVLSKIAKEKWANGCFTGRRGPYYDYRDERLYSVWRGIKQRCNSIYGSYKDVDICDEWLDYLVFREWAYSHGYDKDAPKGQCTIDRINPFGNYEPSNCRFVDLKTQARNKRHHWAQLDEEVREALLATSLVT